MREKSIKMKVIKFTLLIMASLIVLLVNSSTSYAATMVDRLLAPETFPIQGYSGTGAVNVPNINESWYYIVTNSESSPMTIAIDMYGATAPRSGTSQASSHIIGSDILPAGVTRMYIYSVISDKFDTEIVELASADITLNSNGTIASQSNITNLLIIKFAGTESSDKENPFVTPSNGQHRFEVKGNSSVVTQNQWVQSTGSTMLIDFDDAWSNPGVNFLRSATGMDGNRKPAYREYAKISYMLSGTSRPWYFKYNDSRITVTSDMNGQWSAANEAPCYQLGRLTLNVPEKSNPNPISLSPTSLSFTYGEGAKTVSVSRDGDGAIIATSSNTNVASVSLNGNNIIVTPVWVGSATITVSVGEGTGYYAPAPVTFTVTVSDTSLPTATGISLESYTTTGSIRATANGVSDVGVGVSLVQWYMWDSNWNMIRSAENSTGQWYKDFTVTTEGTYYIGIILYDHAGNENNTMDSSSPSYIGYASFIYDKTAPTATSITFSATYTTTGSIRATANGVADNLSGVNRVQWYLYDPNWNPVWTDQGSTGQWYKDIDVSGLSEGTYYVGMVLYDNAGNANDTTDSSSPSYIGWASFYYDRTAPTATSISLSATYTNTGVIRATANGVSDVGTGVNRVQWYLCDPNWNPVWTDQGSTGQWYKDIDVSSLSEGTYYVAIILYDNAGNVNNTTESASPSYIGWIPFYYDKSGPSISVQSDNDNGGRWTSNDVSFKVRATDGFIGMSSLQYSYDASNWNTLTTSNANNILYNSDFKNTYAISHAWDTSKNESTAANSWSEGYNGGVESPTVGYHAHINTTTFGYPVLKFPNRNSEVGLAGRWIGVAQSIEPGKILANTTYTISYEVYSDTIGTVISPGIYHRKTGSTAYDFYNILKHAEVTSEDVGKWSKKTYTFTTSSDFDSTQYSNIYIYGMYGAEGDIYVKNVKLEQNTTASIWTPHSSEQTSSTLTGMYEVPTSFNGNIYFRAVDAIGNVSTTVTKSVYVDGAVPEITISQNGTALTSDPAFASGYNGVYTYNNLGNGNVILERVLDSTVPTNSGVALHIRTTGDANPNHGGFYFANQTAANETYVTKIIAKIPKGYYIEWASNAIGDGGSHRWVTSQNGTGEWETYISYVKTGATGSFSSTNFFYLVGGSTATPQQPVEWDVAYAQVYKNSLMNWTNSDLSLSGTVQDTYLGTVAYAWTTTATEPTSWTTVSQTTGVLYPSMAASENGTYYLWAKDAIGNVSVNATYIERMDKTAPTASSISLSTIYTNTGVIRATANGVADDLSGVNRAMWYLYDSNWNWVWGEPQGSTGEWYKDIDVSGLSEGTYYVGIVLYDNAGNKNDTTDESSPSYIGRKSFVYDKTNPTATSITFDNKYTKTGKITATANGVTDNLTGINKVQWYLYDANWNWVWGDYASTGKASENQWYISMDVSSLAEGVYYVGIIPYDNAGNNDQAAICWTGFYYDKTAPTATGITLSATYTNTGKIRATANGVSDNLTGVNRVQWYLYDANWNWVWAEPQASTAQWYKDIDVSGLAEGTYHVGMILYDYAGNENNAIHGNIGTMTFYFNKSGPKVDRTIERSVHTDFSAWTLTGGAYIDGNGNLVLPSIGANAQSSYIPVDGTKWLMEFDYAPGGGEGGHILMGTSYYDASYTQVTSQNGYDGNGWAPWISAGETKHLEFDGGGGYGSNVKYVKIRLLIDTTYSAISGVISNFRVTSEAQNQVGVRVNVSNSVDITAMKYLWSKQSTGITEAQVTNTFTNGELIRAPFGAQGTYYLWILAKDVAGNTYLKAVEDTYRDTIKIDNPQIEIAESSEPATAGGKKIDVYSFNAENVYKNYMPGTYNGGTVERVASRYIGSAAFKLNKYANENGQWHGLQGPYGNEFSGLAANTYVIVSSDYKTTNSAGVKSFDGNSLWRSDWSYSFKTTSILNNLSINQDGNWNHSSVIIKTNEATDSSGVIVHSGMPTWNKSLVAGEMYIDGIQWFTIPEANLNDGVAIKKWAVGNQSKAYFRTAGNTYTGNSFTTTSNGIHTVYMKTTSGMEIIKTFEVSGADYAGPETSITLNGTGLNSDPTFKNGWDAIWTYNNLNNGNVKITRVKDTSVPNNSGYKLNIKTVGEANPVHGGFCFMNQTAANEIYISKIVAKIPVGYSIVWASNAMGDNPAGYWLTSQEGTGDWKTYIYYLRTGSSGSFSTTNFFYLTGGSTATASAPVEWDVAYAQVYKNSLMNWTNQDVTLTGNIKDELSGTVAYAWTTNATLPTSWTTVSATTENISTPYTVTENGAYYLWAKDALGNVSMIGTVIDRIDKIPPTITNVYKSPSGYTDGSVTVCVSASDNASGVCEVGSSEWTYDYITYSSITPTLAVYDVSLGRYAYNKGEVYVGVKDQAGNFGGTYLVINNIDRTAPIFVDGKTHTAEEYYNNSSKGIALDNVQGFTSTVPDYKGGTQSLTTINDGTVNSSNVLKITHDSGSAVSGWAIARYYETSKVYVRKILAKIPLGYSLILTGNMISATRTDITDSFAGTGDWKEYSCVYMIDDNAVNTMNFGHAYISGPAASSAFDWYVASDVTYDVTNVFDNTRVTYSGANAILNLEAKDTQSGVSSITVNGTAQSLTTSGTSKLTNYTVSSAGTYTMVATDALGYSTTMTKTAYTITYNGNGANSGTVVNQIKIDGADRVLSANSFIRNNYTFTGWNTAANGSGTNYAGGATYTGNANVTLYAQWESAPNYIVDGVNYPTLAEAYAAVKAKGNEGIIKVGASNTDNSTFVIESDMKITLDLNGNTITKEVCNINNHGELIVDDTSSGKNGVLQTLGRQDNAFKTFIQNYGKFTLNNGSVIHNGVKGYWWYTILSTGPEVNINGGALKSHLVDENQELEIDGGNTYVGITIQIQQGTLNMNGGEIYSSTGVAIGVAQYTEDTVNINILGGTVDADLYGINSYGSAAGAQVTVTDGTVKGNNRGMHLNYFTNLTVTGGNIESPGIAIQHTGSGKVVIGNEADAVSTNSPVISGGYYAVEVSNNFEFYDGILKGTGAAFRGTVSKVPTDYAVANGVEGNYKTATLALANYSVNGNGFVTLAEAYNAVKANGAEGTIIVERDNTDSSDFTVEEGMTVIIDTNGKTITKTVSGLINNGTLTIGGNGTIQMTNDHIIQNYGTFTLDGAKLKATLTTEGIISGIWNSDSNSKVIMNSGTINVSSTNATMNNKYGILDFGGTVEVNGGTINMNLEGTCNNYTSAIAMYDGAGTLDISNATINVNGNCSSNISGILVRSGGTATINDGTNITVANSNGESYGIITEIATVDMNAGTINAGTYGIINAGEGIINISETADINGGVSGVINSTGTISSAKIVITGGNVSGNRFGILNEGNGTVIVGNNDGSIDKTSPAIQGDTYAYYASSENATLEFNDGIFKGKETVISGVGKITIPEGYGIFRSTEGEYKTAWLEKGWDISNPYGGINNVWAFLLDDPENEGMYILDVQGTGEMINYTNFGLAPWKAYQSVISKLIIEEGVTSIGDRIFNELYEITEIDLPSTLTYIGTYAFYFCTKLTGSVNIPKNVTEISGNPFLITEVTSINVEAGNTAYKSVDGVLYTINGESLEVYPAGKANSSYTVLEGTKKIAGYSMYKIKAENVVLPNTLQIIGYEAFGESKLTKIVIPSSVTTIYDRAFLNATSLKEVYIKSTNIGFDSYYLDNSEFINISPNSAIYTMSKEIASKFVADVNYTSSKTAVYYPPVITLQPENKKVNTAEQATFRVGVEDGNLSATKYQWQYKVNASVEWANVTDEQGIINADGSFTTVATTQDMNGYRFRVIISNDEYPNDEMTREELAGNLISGSATLTVREPNYSVDGKYFATLADAYAAIKAKGNEGTIKVEASNTDSSYLNIDSGVKITLDLNGNTVTRTSGNVVYGELIIDDTSSGKNGVIQTLGRQYNGLGSLIQNYGKMTLNNGSLINNGIKGNWWYGIIHRGTELNVNGGGVKAYLLDENQSLEDSGAGYNYNGMSVHIEKGILNINNGDIISDTGVAIDIIPTNNNSCDINILGGFIESTVSAAIYSNDLYEVEITVDGGNIKGAREGIYVGEKSTVILKDGKIEGTTMHGIASEKTGKIIIGTPEDAVSTEKPEIVAGGNAISTLGIIEFYDGILKGKQDAINGTVIKTPDGYGITKGVDGEYKTASLTVANYSVDGIYYATLAEAYNAIDGAEGVIKVEGNNTDTSIFIVEEGKKITLDLNNKTITKKDYAVSNNGELVIEDYSSEKNGVIQTLGRQENNLVNLIVNNGNFELNNGSIISNGYLGNYWYALSNNNITNINGGQVKALLLDDNQELEVFGTGDVYRGIGIHAQRGELNINDGYILCDTGAALDIVPWTTDNLKVNILGGIIESTESSAIYTNGIGTNAQITISEGTVKGVTKAIYHSGGIAINIIGGSIEGSDLAIYHIGTGKLVIGDSSNIVSTTTPVIKSETKAIEATNGFEFYDGILKGKQDAISGTVTKVPEGYGVTKGIEGEYKTATLAIANYSVDGSYYATLEDAYNAINGAEGTIKVEGNNISDTTLLNIESGKTITLDTNGKTITKTENSIINEGTLNIIGTGSIVFENIGGIENSGNITLEDAALIANATRSNHGNTCVINYSGAKFTMNSGSLSSSTSVAGGVNHYCILNHGGTIDINGGTISMNADVKFETVNNVAIAIYMYQGNGTLNVKGGKIISDSGNKNSSNVIGICTNTNATITIGTDDGEVSKDVPEICGETFGIASYVGQKTINFYDGIIKGELLAGYDIKCNTPEGYGVFDSSEDSDGDIYKTAYLKKLITAPSVITNLEGTSFEYTGAVITPKVTITDGDTPLVLEEDFEVEYKNHTNVGKATAVITGIGDYMGTKELNFMITQINGILELNPTTGNITYGSNEHTFEVKSSHGGSLSASSTVGNTEIIDGTIKVTGLSGLNAGNTVTVTVTVAETQNHKEISKEYVIVVTAINPVELNVQMPSDFDYTYDGKAKEPKPVVSIDGNVLEEGKDYIVKYSNNTNAGDAEVIVTGIGNYKDSFGTATFKINPIKITVKAGDAEKEYDGNPLSSTEYSVIGTLVEGHTLSAITKGSITEVGTAENVIVSVTISSLNGDETDNYEITKEAGTLEVKKANMTGNVIIEGENRVGEVLSTKVTSEPTAEKVTYKWYVTYTEGATSGGTLLGSGDKLILTESMIGRYVYVEALAEKANHNALTLVDATDENTNKSASVLDAFKPILIEETDSNYIIGNTGISQRKADVSKIIISNTKVKPNGTIISEWDISVEKNKSVMAWLVNTGSAYELHIGGTGRIQATNAQYLFANYTTCTSIEGLEHLDTSKVTNMNSMFKNSKVTTLDIDDFNSENVTDVSNMFYGCESLADVDLSMFNTSNVTNMSNMFNGCKALTQLNVSKFNTTSVRDMSYMFYGCEGLIGLDITKFDTINVEDMSNMFYGCKGLSELNLVTLNTSNVTNMSNMFNGCAGLNKLDVRNFDTSKATNMSSMFEGCNKITELSLVRFDTSKVSDMSNMFKACTNLEEIDVTEFNTALVEDMSSMFEGCSNLTGLNLVSFDTNSLTSSDNMFKNMITLSSMLLGENFKKLVGTNMFNDCNRLNSIIAQSEEAIELGANTGLNSLDTKMFVANTDLESNYEGATNYAQVFGRDRVKVIMELIGEAEVTLNPGDNYTDAGVKVMDVAKEQAKEYMQYGYMLDISGLPVDTSVPGEKEVIYTLKFGRVQK